MNKIGKISRKSILLDLIKNKINIEVSVVRFFDGESKPSHDSRYTNLSGDYFQHRERNLDWDDDWFIEDSRINILDIDDLIFLNFLQFAFHPDNFQGDTQILRKVISIINHRLLNDFFQFKLSGTKIRGIPVCTWSELVQKSKQIYFYTSEFEGERKYPCMVLKENNWDDFGWETTFNTDFYFSNDKWLALGRLKILEKDNVQYKTIIRGETEYQIKEHSKIPETFTKLGPNFCSVFELDESLKELNTTTLKPYKQSILKGLNEASENAAIVRKFRNVPGFETSLMRGNEAYARITNIIDAGFSFGIKHKSGDLNFDFEENPLPHRINVLIGRNGSGKTTILSNIAKEITQFSLNPSDTLLTFRPSFTRIIQVSYSVFDSFTLPKGDDELKYIYCGLRKNDGSIYRIDEMGERLGNSLKRLIEQGKDIVYENIVSELVNEDISDLNILEREFHRYSSGQKILIVILAEILANIEKNSLVLFDEPETHLHPNMIFRLMKALYTLLQDNESYLIIATHSPIVIQQIPSKYVCVVDELNGNSNLNIECFGENFSNITREVFSNYEIEEVLYKELFKSLSNRFSEEEILLFFESELNLNARIYLKTIYKSKENAQD